MIGMKKKKSIMIDKIKKMMNRARKARFKIIFRLIVKLNFLKSKILMT